MKNWSKLLLARLLSRNLPSQNRVFSEKRPLTREFGKEMPFGEGEEGECLLVLTGRLVSGWFHSEEFG